MFVILLQIPMLTGSISVIDRSIVNMFSLVSAGLIYLLINRKVKLPPRTIVVYCLIIGILFIQYSKTALDYEVTDGLATLLRYTLYLTVGIITYKNGVDIRVIKYVILISIIICILSSVLGIVQNRYVYLNGWNRFTGSNYSSVGLALEASFCLFLIYARFLFLEPHKPTLSLKTIGYMGISAALTYIIYLTGSRGPALGVIAIIYIHTFFNKKIIFLTLLILPIIFINILYEASDLSSNRILVLFTNLKEVYYYDDIRNMGGSIFNRIDYIEVGVSYIYKYNLAFGAGLNSFQGIYEAASGRDRVAAHNDFLLVLVEFGYIGFGLFLFILALLLFKCIKSRNNFTLTTIIFWLSGLSLNNVLYYHSVATLLVMILALSMSPKHFKNYT
jgi:O-antigen ligase